MSVTRKQVDEKSQVLVNSETGAEYVFIRTVKKRKGPRQYEHVVRLAPQHDEQAYRFHDDTHRPYAGWGTALEAAVKIAVQLHTEEAK